MRSPTSSARIGRSALALLTVSCGSEPPRAPAAEVSPAPSVTATASSDREGPAKPWGELGSGDDPSDGACPADMLLVDTTHCTDVKRTCLDSEYSSSNKITLCHKFKEAPGTCVGDERRVRFCVDRYEYPNKLGARSPVMVDFYDAMAICAESKKRLCWEGEWIAACEGPDKTPFPYGYSRDPSKCNIDRPWIHPSLDKMYSTDPGVAAAELARLDEAVPSGAKPECKSGFGVHDQPGNVDEWVMLEKKRGEGGWAGLKGGAWGHVRNACRPVTTSHAPEFTYYFVSFRCCADAQPDLDKPAPAPWKPPPLPPQKKASDKISRGWTPK